MTGVMSSTAPAAPADWLWAELGLRVDVRNDPAGEGLDALVGLALRRNPRRAHLLVSRVLGKHLPVPPGTALGVGAALAARVRALPGFHRAAGRTVVIGYCETATALGHAVADGLPDSHYLHTTRRRVPGHRPLLEFVESHSHATHHWLMPADPDILDHGDRLVLVDDELSTGRTALGTIRTLHTHAPRSRYAVATLVDARPPQARAAFDALAHQLGIRIDVVSLIAATVAVPDDVALRAQRVRERFAPAGSAPAGSCPPGADRSGHPVVHLGLPWPAELPDGARHGWSAADGSQLVAELPGLAARLAAEVAVCLEVRSGDTRSRDARPGEPRSLPARGNPTGSAARILMLGTEELMYVPMRLADSLARLTGWDVRYQSTTRSPVHPVDLDGYAIRCALTFPAPDDPARVSHVYNVAPDLYDHIVVVVDRAMDGLESTGTAPATAGLAAALSTCAPVTVLTIPSYRGCR